jgi:small-conductance mechanosensitive channel
MSPARFTPEVEGLLARAGYPAGAGRDWLAGAIAAITVLAVTFAASWLLTHVAARVARRLAQRTVTDIDDRLLDIVEKPLRRLVVSVGLYLALSQLPLPRTAAMLLSGLVVVYIAYFAVRIASQVSLLLLIVYGARVADDVGKERFEKDYLPLLSKIVGTVFSLVGLIYVLHHFGQNVTSLIAALGIGGAAIGLAAKDTLGNMFAGFVILVDRPFRPGDTIRLATGETGSVIDVGTRSTRIKLGDLNMLIVPNSELVNTRVVNLNFPSHAALATLEVRVAFGSDVDAVKALLLEIVRAQPEVLAEPPPGATLASFGDFGLVLTVSYVVSQFADAGKVQDLVRTAVYRRFREAGIKIPVPVREIVQATR